MVSFLRTYELWDTYSERVTLYFGQLAHATGRIARALQCYRVVSGSPDGNSELAAMGKVGEIVLRIGVSSQGISFPWGGDEEEFNQMATEVVQKCLGGTWGEAMVIVGRVLEASVCGEIVRSK